MKKNAQLHLWLESELLNTLQKQASEEGLTLAQICREKLKEQTKLNRIEFVVERLEEVLLRGKRNNRKIFWDRKFYIDGHLKNSRSNHCSSRFG